MDSESFGSDSWYKDPSETRAGENCLGADVALLPKPSLKEADPGKADFQERSKGPKGNRDSLG